MTASPPPDMSMVREVSREVSPHNVSQSQSQSQGSEPCTDPPKKKRQKIALACDTCRIRKVRCDGIRPICGLCAKRKDKGIGCAWTGEKDKSYRLSAVVNQTIPVRRERLSDSDGFGSGNRFWTADGPGTAIDSLSGSTIAPQEEPTKGIDSMTGIGGDDSNSQEFFGSSSAGSFTRQIRSAIDTKIGRPAEPRTSRTSLFQLSPTSYQARSPNDNIDYLLPSRKTGDGLMAVYWTLVHPLYPFLDRHMFEKSYDSIWSGSSASVDERVLMCTVNAMFALASQLSDSAIPEQRDAYAKVYFKRAQDLLRLDLWDIGSTELIQCLLIMGQYLQSTNTPHQCWMVIGHAIRVAQGLGFHLSESSVKLQSPREREVARRIWYGCIMMDRVLSMTFGRPAMISKSLSDAVPLPAAIDDEFIGNGVYGPNRQPEGQPSMMAFYVRNLHLYAIINDILLALYVGQDNKKHDNQHSLFNQTESSDITRVFEIDQALMTWGQTLPLHLRISSMESSRTSIFFRQAVICRARFLHARILLFRPILSKFCLPQSNPTVSGTLIDESLAERMVLQCSTLCLRQAHDMIDLIYANLNLESLSGPLPAWWYTVLYVYTAATILLAARLRPVIAKGVADYSIAGSWAHAIEILNAFSRLGHSAQRCVAALEILHAKVSIDINPTNVHHDLPVDSGHGPTEMASDSTAADHHFDEYYGSNFTFDLNDMSWLTSLPGNL